MNHAIADHAHSSPVEAFVARHQAGVWRWLRALGCEASRAEEHCQDALLAALHDGIDRLPTADANRWLRRAAKNLFLMQLRAERRRPQWHDLDTLEEAWLALAPDDDGADAALTALSRCLLTLAARDRDLVARRYQQREPRAATAAALDLTEAGVKQALRRVRDKLRTCVLRRLDADAPEHQQG
ncbi:MAG: sigma-70 family RNA polymerase sigma factor [Planctomycetes bacterium]|nr:sigma-70 family RNA polymerase sigma factor [Planctomycetota bacterium]